MSSRIKRPAKKQQPTPEEYERSRINETLHEVAAMDTFTHGQRRTFAVGDTIRFGSNPGPKVVDNLGGGVYRIEMSDGKRIIVPWFAMHHPLPEVVVDYGKCALRLDFITRDVGGLLEYGRSGVEMNPAYQRDLVWNDSDRQSLLTSVMNGIDIGKFVFAMNNYGDPFLYEIIDGKQRLSTLMGFFLGTFKWLTPGGESVDYSGLSKRDRGFFLRHTVQVAEIPNNPSQEERIRAFLHINTSGRRVDEAHIRKVRELYLK